MRTLAVAVGLLALVLGATPSAALDVTVLPKPDFPARVDITPKGRIVAISSRYRLPYLSSPPAPLPAPPAWAPRRFRGAALQVAIRQPSGPIFFVYGRDGSSGRYLLGANPRTRTIRYAFDFVNFWHAPGGAGGWLQEVVWAREANGVLFVQNAHLTYANATRELNAYVSAIDVSRGKTLWRSPALVGNARNFLLAGNDRIVAGYGFTNEPDFLYLLDRRTGRALDRIPLPTAPEIIKLRRGRLHVRTYDSDVVARIVR